MRASRSITAPVLSLLALSATLGLAGGCAGPKTAPPPAMGDLSGSWLLVTEERPVRFVSGDGDTTALIVRRDPLVLRQGSAVSDSSIAVEMIGLFVSGATHMSKRIDGHATVAEFVTAGPSEGMLSFEAPALSFEGTWDGREFSGHFRVDEERAGKNAQALDPQQVWTLRRLGGGTN